MTETESVAKLLKEGRQILGGAGMRLDTELLLGHCLGLPRTSLIARADQIVSKAQSGQFKSFIEKRRAGLPMAYLLERQAFWNRDFHVSRDTLIPRPDTELLVSTILDRWSEACCTVIDLGTGSGAIAVSIAQERPNWTVFATDQSLRALRVAQRNGRDLDNLYWVQADWLQGFKKAQFDIIVANPPYIAHDDPHLPQLQYEPQNALIAADNGLRDLKIIMRQAKQHLTKAGHLLLEHGYDQQNVVVDLMQALGWQSEKLSDLSGHPRAVIGHLGA